MLEKPSCARIEAVTGQPCTPDDKVYQWLCDFIDAVNIDAAANPDKSDKEIFLERFDRFVLSRKKTASCVSTTT